MKKILFITAILVFTGMQANAELIGVAQVENSYINNVLSSFSAEIIPAPQDALDDDVENSAMQGFNEAQGVLTSVAHGIDGGGSIAAGTLVDSHMIFLNSTGTTAIGHFDVTWTFDGAILGVMSNQSGTLEAASTFELGNPATNYTVGAGAAPFSARGLEGIGNPSSGDGYTILGNTITVGMYTNEPGDWIRVVTNPVPVPGAFLLGSLGLGFASWRLKRRRTA